MDALISGLCKTVESVAHLASPENIENPVQINSRQCDLLATKASGVLHVLEELRKLLQREFIKDGPELTPALEGLHRVLKDAESLIRDCCCGCLWLKVAIKRGNLNETFAKLLYDIEWHTSVLCGVLVTTSSNRSDVFDRSACEGKLGVAEDFMLSLASKQDRESLRLLLNGTPVYDRETHNPEIAVDEHSSQLDDKFLKKLDAEETKLDRHALSLIKDQSPLFLWISWDDLKQGPDIGVGASATVREVTWLGQRYAMKIFNYGTDLSGLFREEIAAMAGLDHPHIVRVVCCLEDDDNIGIVMERMYKSLNKLLEDRKRHTRTSGSTTLFPIIHSVDLMLQIGEGVKYLHSKNLAHRDLKSLNILVQFADLQAIPNPSDALHFTDSSTANPLIAKIADFGLTKTKNASTANQTLNIGTTAWMAPELFGYEDKELLEPSPRFRPFKMDAYSFGMVCYEILTGKTPFSGKLPREFKPLVKGGTRPELPAEIIPTRLGRIIQQCWDKDSRRRPDFSTICTELRYIKGLLLQGKSLEVFDLKPEIKAQGPWGGNGGGHFSDGVVTSIKQLKLKYDTDPRPCIWYIEITYDIDGKPFTIGHGDAKFGKFGPTIDIDEPSEYITQIEGSYGIVPLVYGGGPVTGLTSLTIRTTEKTHGPFGVEIGSKFKSDAGRIIGFHGRSGMTIDQIGCFIAPAED